MITLRRRGTWVGVVLLAATEPAAAQGRSYTFRVEAGGELDSNAKRAEKVDGAAAGSASIASPVGRLVLAGQLGAALLAGSELNLSAAAAGKLFADPAARSEDVAVGEAAAGWRTAVGRRFWLGAGASYYEAVQRGREDARDFRSLSPAARVDAAVGAAGTAGLGAGFRFFTFKPEPDLDFRAPTLSVDYRHLAIASDETAEWELGGAASLELRDFAGLRQELRCPPGVDSGPTCGPMPGTDARRDRFATGALDVTRVGRVLVGAGYGLHWNHSNSYGEGLLRHLVHLRAAAQIPVVGIYIAARAELLLARYDDPVPVGHDAGMVFLTIEDEARSSVRLEATQNLGRLLQAVARWVFYTNEIGTRTVHYRRQTGFVGLAFLFDADVARRPPAE